MLINQMAVTEYNPDKGTLDILKVKLNPVDTG